MDLKHLFKKEHADERHRIAQDDVSIGNIQSVSKEGKKELIEELQIPVGEVCLFPQHKVYAEIRKKLPPDQQKKMKENIKVTADGKIEIVKMKKKFSVLQAEHNGKDIFDGSHKDRKYFSKNGIKGLTYLTNRAAEEECEKQGKRLLNDVEEVKKFISFFPGETPEEKIFNFVNLFALERTGFLNVSKNKWTNVDSFGYALLSKTNGKADVLCGVTWGMPGDGGLTRNYGQDCAMPFVAYEDCVA